MVLAFADDAEAEAAVASLKQDDRFDGGGHSSMTVQGLYPVPTRFCGCPAGDALKPRRIVRGSRLGWWVHEVCRRPVKLSMQLPVNLLTGPRPRDYVAPLLFGCAVDV